MSRFKFPFGSASACCCFACSFGRVWGCELPCLSLYCGRGLLRFSLCCCCVNKQGDLQLSQPQAQWQLDCCLCRCALGCGDGSPIPNDSTSTSTTAANVAPGVAVMERSSVTTVTPVSESTTIVTRTIVTTTETVESAPKDSGGSIGSTGAQKTVDS